MNEKNNDERSFTVIVEAMITTMTIMSVVDTDVADDDETLANAGLKPKTQNVEQLSVSQ